MNYVSVLIIHHKYGEDIYVCESHELAIDQAHKFVTAWWSVEPETHDEKIPKDKEEAIQTYFELVEDEYCDIRDDIQVIKEKK